MLDYSYRLIKSFERRIRRKIKGKDPNLLPRDFDEPFRPIFEACRPFTMTSPPRMFTLYESVRYVIEKNIPGDFVECGVWRGGSAMVMAMTLKLLNQTDRTLWLYDTFEGMTMPSEKDVDLDGRSAVLRWNTEWASSAKQDGSGWCYASLEEVRENVLRTGYPSDKVRFLKGKVEETIPRDIPQTIALLRLDTDWYESTYHEFVHLYPRLQTGGVLILDDYGSWQGARAATDQYFDENGHRPFLSRIDEAARVGIKM